jgi:hypothetical protein
MNKNIKEWTIEKQKDKFVLKTLHTNLTQNVRSGYIGWKKKKYLFKTYKEYKQWWDSLPANVFTYKRKKKIVDKFYKKIPAPDRWMTEILDTMAPMAPINFTNVISEISSTFIRYDNYETFEDAFEMGMKAFSDVPFVPRAKED